MTDVFNDDTIKESLRSDKEETINSYAELLVGEDRKFKDFESLAKGKYESDKFIAKIEAENEEMRKQLAKSSSVDEVFEKIRQLQNKELQGSSKDDSTQGASEKDGEKGSLDLTEDKLNEILEKRLNEREQKARAVENLKKIETVAREAYGEDYRTEINRKAGELGLDASLLNQMAQTNPDAVIKILNITPSSNKSNDQLFTVNPSVRNTDIGSNNRNTGIPKYSDYSKLRKENPTEFYSPKVQNKLMELASKYGEAFLEN